MGVERRFYMERYVLLRPTSVHGLRHLDPPRCTARGAETRPVCLGRTAQIICGLGRQRGGKPGALIGLSGELCSESAIEKYIEPAVQQNWGEEVVTELAATLCNESAGEIRIFVRRIIFC